MFRALLATQNEFSLTIARLFLGIVIFMHGAQLMLGWFGGFGYAGSMQFFTQTLHIPVLFAWLAIMSQFIGAIALIVGLFTRIAAIGIAIDMLVAIFKIHIHVGFFMNWYGTLKGEGYEYHLLALALCLVLMARGGGALSIDGAVYEGTR
jgi:putative oxidoreductase